MPKVTAIFLSAIIITKNEEKNLRRTLASLQGIADEIIVVDSYSTDKTQEICQEFEVKFIQKEWEGYAKTKNWANQQASSDYILSLDADEMLSEELKTSILFVKNNHSGIFAYKINRLTNYCGKWIRHCGWYPEHRPRLFDRRITKWEGDFVHERLVSTSDIKWTTLKGDCYHYSFYTVSQHIDKINHFSSLAAEERLDKGKTISIIKLLFSPPIKFFIIFFLRLGFLDGIYGFTIAMLSSWHNFLREIKMLKKV